eukprot:gene11209-11359_t
MSKIDLRAASLDESRAPPPEPTKWMVGNLTPYSLAFYNGSDWSKPTVISVKGVIYDVTKSNDLYGPGKQLSVFAGRECARALAKGSLSFKDCTDDLSGCTEEELQKLEQEEDRVRREYDEVGKLVPMKDFSLEDLAKHNGSNPELPMLLSIRGVVYDITSGKQFYGPDGMPYNVKALQANHPVITDISRRFKSKVLFCVIDTGLDRSNPEFDLRSTSGCEPGHVRLITGTPHYCSYSWYNDIEGHGTHTSGTIAARKNGKDIVGMSAEGAQIYHYNIFGDRDAFDYTDAVPAWQDCLNELDYRRAATGIKDMRLVISMSFGADSTVAPVGQALQQLAAERGDDVLWIASAGNDGTDIYNYPAAAPEVVSVGAVNWDWEVASFSNFNDDVEWVAPGVQVLSTIPTALANISSYNDDLKKVVLEPFEPPFDAPDLLSNPVPQVVAGSKLGRIAAPIVDCGSAATSCREADGKVCLIKRDKSMTFCQMVRNCVLGGGVAAVVWNEDTQQPCLPLLGAELQADYLCEETGGFPIVMAISYAQGAAIKMALTEESQITLDTGSTGNVALEYASGTSMAAPAAECTASEIRAALSASALDLGTGGRDNYYGYGGVQALAAHQYLITNRCAAEPSTNIDDPPSPPPETSQQRRGQAALQWGVGWSLWVDMWLISGFAASAPIISHSPPVAFTPTLTQPTSPQAIDDHLTASSSQWVSLDVLENDQGTSTGVIAYISAHSPTASGATVAGSDDGKSLKYLSKPGWVGQDRFTYSILDVNGKETTAAVTVNVTPGSCRGNFCSPDSTARGGCTAGGCRCKAGSGLVPTHVPNPSPAFKQLMPFVPACRLPQFSSTLTNVTAKASPGSKVELKFSFKGVTRCWSQPAAAGSSSSNRNQNGTDNVVRSLAFKSAKCPSAWNCGPSKICNPSAVVRLPPSKAAEGRSCKEGTYRLVAKVPASKGCYNLNLQLVDKTKHSVRMLVL